MTPVFIPHRIPAADRLDRLVLEGFTDRQAANDSTLRHLDRASGRVDLEAVVEELLGEREPPWVEKISGKIQLAIEDADGEPTGEIAELVIVDGICEVPDEHLDHVLKGVRGAYVVTDEEAPADG